MDQHHQNREEDSLSKGQFFPGIRQHFVTGSSATPGAPSSSAVSSSSSTSAPPTEPMPPISLDEVNWREDESEEKRKKRENQRIHVGLELLSIENNFVENLSFLLDVFIRPLVAQLQEDEEKEKEGGEDFNRFVELFAPIDVIHRHHSSLLSRFLIIREWENFPPEKRILEPILEDIPLYVRGYDRFISNYNDMIEFLQEKKKTNPTLSAYYKKFAKSAPGKNVPDYLIFPIQHIPRYKLLLQRMYEKTTPMHVDFVPLFRGTYTLHNIGKEINEVMQKSQNGKKIMEIQNKLSGKAPNLLTPSRRFMMEGPLVRHPKLDRHYFLFNDLLVETRINQPGEMKNTKNKDEFFYLSSWPLEHVKILEGAKVEGPSNSAFPGVRVHSAGCANPHLSIRFVFSSPLSKGTEIVELETKTEKSSKMWLDSLKESLKEVSANQTGLMMATPSEERKKDRWMSILKKKTRQPTKEEGKEEGIDALVSRSEAIGVSFEAGPEVIIRVVRGRDQEVGYLEALRDGSFAVVKLIDSSAPLSSFLFRMFSKAKTAKKV